MIGARPGQPRTESRGFPAGKARKHVQLNHYHEKKALVWWSRNFVAGRDKDPLPPLEKPLEELDWPWLVEAAVAHKVEPIFGHNLSQVPEAWSKVPKPIRNQLVRLGAETYLQYQAKYDAIHKFLGEITKRGGRAVVLRGASLSAYYPEPHLRRFDDLDLLVAREEIPLIREILAEQGFSPDRKGAESGGEASSDVAYGGLSFCKTTQVPIMVEFQDPCHYSYGTLRLIDTSAWWENARPAILFGAESLVLTNEEYLLLLGCFVHIQHIQPGAPRRLSCLLDLYCLIQQGIDWSVFLANFLRLKQAQEQIQVWFEGAIKDYLPKKQAEGFHFFDCWEVPAHINFSLSAVNELFGEVVPAWILEATKPEEPKLRDVALVLNSLTDERLYLWQATPGARFLDYGSLTKQDVLEQRVEGILSYWRQLPPWTSWDDGHVPAYAELSRRAPSIKY